MQGDVIDRLRELPDESVHCVVTSPPYWGLRDYGVKGQIGLEKTPALYLAKMVAVFAEVRRVLRPDGTCWVNMGDSYSNDTKWGGSSGGKNYTSALGRYQGQRVRRGKDCDPKRGAAAPGQPFQATVGPFKPKDLCGMPWRLAFALQEDGWWLRQDIIWSKPNPMPESVTDRCTKAHEYIFLLTKSARYFYDAEAIKEEANTEPGSPSNRFDRADYLIPGQRPQKRAGRAAGNKSHKLVTAYEASDTEEHRTAAGLMDIADTAYPSRNKRSVWEIATEAFPEAHFATFPTKLVEPCILAGTSEKGCCDRCRAPYERVVEKEFKPQADVNVADGVRGAADQKPMDASNGWDGFPRGTTDVKTIAWQPTCKCSFAWPIPCTVLDPFNGSGTTGVVALRYHRNYIGIEINQEYAAMAERRIHGDNPMFNRQEEQVPA